jgi:hypothetical protein
MPIEVTLTLPSPARERVKREGRLSLAHRGEGWVREKQGFINSLTIIS